MNRSRATNLVITTAAIVVVVAGMREARGIIGPVMLALALTIVFHPLRTRLERRLPSWAASIVVLVCAYVLILLLIVSLIVAIILILGGVALGATGAPTARRDGAGRPVE